MNPKLTTMGGIEMQTILGSGGVIGNGLARELRAFADRVRLVARNPRPVRESDEAFPADLTDPEATTAAVAGSEVVYLVAGLPYNAKIWERNWPVIMENVIAACREAGARLVFFDNVYLYGRVEGVMTEETPANPSSAKGRVRARIAGDLTKAMARGEVNGLIARAADFYGPGAVNTFVHPMVFEKLRVGKKAAWLVNETVPHSMTYTPDACRATALLGNTPEAFGKVWHLATHPDPPTGRQFIEAVAAEFGAKPRWQVLKPWMLRMAGLFDSRVRESMELLYQSKYPYLFDSSRFEHRFFAATPYKEGIRETVRWMRNGE
jgi:nucleoside-diphosphate-sugar epimerase